MRKALKKFAFLLALVISASTISGCDSSSLPFIQQNNDDGTGKEINLSISDVPSNLDPQTADNEGSMTVISNIYEGLLKKNQNGDIVNGVASKYEISSDGLTYTFTIRDDAKWFYDKNDDNYMDDDEFSPVTADDFVFAFQRIYDPDTESPFQDMFKMIENADPSSYKNIGVEAKDDKTVVFHLKKANAEFLSLLTNTAAIPCNKEFFESTKGRYGLDKESVNSNGPFFIQQWFYDEYGSNNFIHMHRNINYNKNDTVSPKRVDISIEKDDDTVKDNFKDGTTDVLLTDEYYNKYFTDNNYTVNDYKNETSGLIFNPDDKIFSNENIRQALIFAIDSSALENVIGSEVSVANGIVPPAVNILGKSYREINSEGEITIKQDIEKAKQLANKGLSESGEKKFPNIKILVSSTSVNCSYLQPIIDQWSENLGLYATFDEVDEAEYKTRISEKNYQIALYDLTSNTDSVDSFLSPFCESSNVFGLNSSEIKSLYSSLEDYHNLKDYIPVYFKIEKNIINSYYFKPLFYKSDFLVTTSNVSGFIYDPFEKTLKFQYVTKKSSN